MVHVVNKLITIFISYVFVKINKMLSRQTIVVLKKRLLKEESKNYSDRKTDSDEMQDYNAAVKRVNNSKTVIQFINAFDIAGFDLEHVIKTISRIVKNKSDRNELIEAAYRETENGYLL